MYGWSPQKYLHLYLGKCKGKFKGKAHIMDGLNGIPSSLNIHLMVVQDW